MRALYTGNDLHGNNNLVGIVDEQGKRTSLGSGNGNTVLPLWGQATEIRYCLSRNRKYRITDA